MSAIGREGGHSRGARARAAAGSGANAGNNSVTDSGRSNASGTGSQPFVRQANEERSGFEGSSGRSSGSGISAYTAQDRGSSGAARGNESRNDRDRDSDRRDSSSGNGPFAGRDEI
jgi:hypothetical protein